MFAKILVERCVALGEGENKEHPATRIYCSCSASSNRTPEEEFLIPLSVPRPVENRRHKVANVA